MTLEPLDPHTLRRDRPDPATEHYRRQRRRVTRDRDRRSRRMRSVVVVTTALVVQFALMALVAARHEAWPW